MFATLRFEASFANPQDPCDSIASLLWSHGQKQYNLRIHSAICKHHIEGKCRKSQGSNKCVHFWGPSSTFSSKFGRFPISIICNLQASSFSPRTPRAPCKWQHPPLPDVHWALTQLTDSVRDVTSGAMEPLRPVAVQPWDAELHSSTTQAPRVLQ